MSLLWTPECFSDLYNGGRWMPLPIFSLHMGGRQIALPSLSHKNNGGSQSSTCPSLSLAPLKNGPKGGISVDTKVPEINIWWDVQRCPLPKHFEAPKVFGIITGALRRMNLSGPIQLCAYMDQNLENPEILTTLHATGVVLIDKPDGWEENRLIEDLRFYARRHPPPAVHMVISDDREVHINSLAQLQTRGYRVLFVTPQASAVAAALGVWVCSWETFLAEGALPQL